jgi:hypothetical protein
MEGILIKFGLPAIALLASAAVGRFLGWRKAKATLNKAHGLVEYGTNALKEINDLILCGQAAAEDEKLTADEFRAGWKELKDVAQALRGKTVLDDGMKELKKLGAK